MITDIAKFDWRTPNYVQVYEDRIRVLKRIRAQPSCLPDLKLYYRNNPADFISDWGITFDPRNAELGLPTYVPFILFPRQREWVDWVVGHWRARTPGLCEKSRDMGISWLAMALSCTLCLFHDGVAIGVGSRKTEYVDKIGTMKPLLPKCRIFMEHLPAEFRGDWQPNRDAPFMRITFPETSSIIGGEGGDDLGRGDRTSLFLVDEYAYFERPELTEMSLSQTTNCRIDMSSVNGMNNAFAQKRHGGKVDVFIFDWRAQPLDAKLLTPSGWRLMGDIRKGDPVIGSDGKPTEVLSVHPQGAKEVYRVSFNDGASTECCHDHLWSVITYGNQRASRRHLRHVLPLKEIMKDYVRPDTRGGQTHRYQIPVSAPVSGFAAADLTLDPYVLGYLLGDGSLPSKPTSPVYLVTSDEEIVSYVNERLPTGCSMKWVRGIQYRIAADASRRGGPKGRGLYNPVNAAIKALGLSGSESHTKFVPEVYKLASVHQRIELLRGLLDTDGHAAKSDPGSARYSTTSKQLAEDVIFISQTLGGTAKLYRIKPKPIGRFPGGRFCRRREEAYIVAVRLPEGIVPFNLSRKVLAYKPAVRFPVRRSIVDIRLVGTKECQCIKTAADDGLYLTDDCIVTHNSDPRKDQEWYDKLPLGADHGGKGLDPVTIAQEVDRDYSASVYGIVIPGAWVRAAIDAHEKLKIKPTGAKGMSLDVADEGADKNAACRSHGFLIEGSEEWSGKGSDIYATVERAFQICDEHGYTAFDYDSDGLGAGVRGDARIINDARRAAGAKTVAAVGWRGSEAVVNPEGIVEGTKGREGDKGRKNEDFFANRKAQGWWALRRRFQLTYRWLVEGIACSPDEIVSISSKCPNYMRLVAELSQPTYATNGVGKIVVNKKPDGMKSPNCFIAGTLVATPQGDIPIESIVEGDEVETPFGRSKVIKTWISETSVLTSARFSTGALLTGTPDHRVFVWGKGKVRLDDLMMFCRMEPYRKRRLLWGIVSSLYMRERSSGFMALVDIIARVTKPLPFAFFIAACGLTITALSRKIITSITRMAIGATMIFPTWSAFQVESTARCIWSSDCLSPEQWKETPKIWRRRAARPRLGIGLPKVEHGTRSTGNNVGKVANLIWRFASIAGLNFRRSEGHSAATSIGNGPTAVAGQLSKRNAFGAAIRSLFGKVKSRAVVVSDVQRFSVPETSVYNLTLENDNAYYANGVLVFNCADAAMIRFAPKEKPAVRFTQADVAAIVRAGATRRRL